MLLGGNGTKIGTGAGGILSCDLSAFKHPLLCSIKATTAVAPSLQCMSVTIVTRRTALTTREPEVSGTPVAQPSSFSPLIGVLVRSSVTKWSHQLHTRGNGIIVVLFTVTSNIYIFFKNEAAGLYQKVTLF